VVDLEVVEASLEVLKQAQEVLVAALWLANLAKPPGMLASNAWVAWR